MNNYQLKRFIASILYSNIHEIISKKIGIARDYYTMLQAKPFPNPKYLELHYQVWTKIDLQHSRQIQNPITFPIVDTILKEND